MDSFNKWLERGAITLKNLMILDQFLYKLPQEIGPLIKDLSPKTVKEAAVLVD